MRSRVLLVLLTVALSVNCRREEKPPAVILISVDTLRSDHLPAYGYSDFDLSMPAGSDRLISMNINNIFQSHADYRNEVGLGYPLALNHFASASNGDYAPFFGSAATERFNLPFRTIEFAYQVKTR